MLLFGSLPPEILEELNNYLQLSPKTRIGDWYFFENQTIIRVYGFEDEPFLLPAFLTPRIYALEYIRQRFALYFEHFGKFKKP